MQRNQPPPVATPSIIGDPATRKFGLFLFGALALITIGVIVGIAAGNIAHYKYFSPYNSMNISDVILFNNTSLRTLIIAKRSRLRLLLTQRIQNVASFGET